MHHHSHTHPSLAHDLDTLLRLRQGRRDTLRWLGAGAAAALAGCGGGGDAASATTATSTTGTTTGTGTGTGSTGSTTGSTSASCATIPEETAGPYPGDGTNTGGSGGVANALTLSGVVRNDITSSFAGATGTAAGVPLTVKLQLVNTASSCASLAGFAVYLWHCDALGRYSMYSQGVTAENYLRGVQVSDSAGELTFSTIFPGCYDGRWPHIHFEVYASLARATSGSNDIKTSQLAMPAAAAGAVYADARYTGSSANFSRISLASDNVFSDGATLQLPTITGSNAAGYVATLQVGVSA
ncbi:MAG: intradiol ring-cleavage dioxygenase [Ramlibacter sp.]|nr:intradiol ring-cleavage dioxygenase [Ramlibacter sp.]MCW5649400.1 intradiol ring-cleavage dioxygenase [Ramlibacter sp.]